MFHPAPDCTVLILKTFLFLCVIGDDEAKLIQAVEKLHLNQEERDLVRQSVDGYNKKTLDHATLVGILLGLISTAQPAVAAVVAAGASLNSHSLPTSTQPLPLPQAGSGHIPMEGATTASLLSISTPNARFTPVHQPATTPVSATPSTVGPCSSGIPQGSGKKRLASGGTAPLPLSTLRSLGKLSDPHALSHHSTPITNLLSSFPPNHPPTLTSNLGGQNPSINQSVRNSGTATNHSASPSSFPQAQKRTPTTDGHRNVSLAQEDVDSMESSSYPAGNGKRPRASTSIISPDSHLDCPLCFHRYDEKDYQPRILPCGHTICETNLLSIIHSTWQRQCPVCCADIPVLGADSYVNDFPINHSLMQGVRNTATLKRQCGNDGHQDFL